MITFQITTDELTKQEADKLFEKLGLDTATAINIFLKASIEHAGIPFPVRRKKIPADLMQAVTDSRERRNLHKPFETAEEAK